MRRDDLSLTLRSRERGGRVHQADRLAVFLHGLGELGVLLFLLGFDLALRVVAIRHILHERGCRGLIDFVVRVVQRGRQADENASQFLNLGVGRCALERRVPTR